VCLAVLVEQPGVVHRERGEPLVVVVRRVPDLAQQPGDEFVALAYRLARLVDEVRLHLRPLRGVLRPGRRRQRLQLELRVPAFPVAQFPLRGRAAVLPGDQPVVLRPEPLPQRPAAHGHHGADDQGSDHHEDDDENDDLNSGHDCPPLPGVIPAKDRNPNGSTPPFA